MNRQCNGKECFKLCIIYFLGAPGGAVGRGTALQVGRSRVRSPIVALEFIIDINFPARYGPGVDSVSNRNEYQEYLLRGVKAAGA